MVELPSASLQLDKQPIPTKVHSAAKPVSRINTPLDGPSYPNQRYGSAFSPLPTLESPQSYSGASTASYSPNTNLTGGLDRSVDRKHHGVLNYGGPNVLGGVEPHYYDSEKQSLSVSDFPDFRDITSRARPAAAIYNQDASTDEDSNAEDHALWILIYLSVLSPLLSILNSLYTLFALLLLILLAPFRFCTSRANFSAQIIRYFAPPLDTQLGFICSPIIPVLHKPSMLVLVNLLSPIYALGIAISAWVAAAFWCYAAILGDPDDRDSKNDGVVAVMGVRWWWEVWLSRAVH
ncbi:MAG: hypothetical protein FRX48_01462 [Lasallia pustulata]|uniref:Uncharacterized protein n=1 Tax=Lasallia pustulata TaxID=136370 RepID=A0A5M8Q032_9LECA|nr:MAG: hypothetical protein FRX48_01462 [Lasallia pustulata]